MNRPRRRLLQLAAAKQPAAATAWMIFRRLMQLAAAKQLEAVTALETATAQVFSCMACVHGLSFMYLSPD